MPNIVEVNNLVKRYPGSEQPAVRGVSFAIQRGEIFGLLGPAGAGKTTLIALLAGLLKPTSGSATVAGFDLVRQPREIKRRVGLAPKDPALYPALSANNHSAFYGRIFGLRGKQLKRQPEILFLDEPTVGVDPQSREAIFANVEGLHQQGITVLYATGRSEEAERLCQRVALIDQGRIVALDTPLALQDALGGGLIVIGLPACAPDTLDLRLRTLPGVCDIARFDHYLKITAGSAQQILPEVINVFNELDINIQSLEVLEPNLESVFLELTGKRLRD